MKKLVNKFELQIYYNSLEYIHKIIQYTKLDIIINKDICNYEKNSLYKKQNGNGRGDGSGYGYGYKHGDGSGRGDGSGYGGGYGDGKGSGRGDGSGYGGGYGDGYENE